MTLWHGISDAAAVVFDQSPWHLDYRQGIRQSFNLRRLHDLIPLPWLVEHVPVEELRSSFTVDHEWL